MNIRFGMDNFYTRYLKRFLNYHLTRSASVLGEFKVEDLKSLIKYLNYPNTETIFEVQKNIVQEFPDLLRLFVITLESTEILLTSKVITEEASEYIQNNATKIDTYCRSMGWEIGEVSSWVDINYDINSDGRIDEVDRHILSDIVNDGAIYDEEIMRKADINLDGFINQEDLLLLDDYINTHKIYFKIKSEGRENIFPNQDMLVFVNQFEGDFLYNYAIRDTDGVTDTVHPHNPDEETGLGMKVGIYKCKPRSKNYNSSRLFSRSTFSNWLFTRNIKTKYTKSYAY